MMIVTDENIKQHWYKKLTDEYVPEVIALAQFLNTDEPDYEGAEYDYDSEDYLILTDDEADEAVRDYIEESVWAFNPSFLRAHTGVDEEVFTLLQQKCEDSNDAIKSMIKDFDHFVNDAVACDGRGHFLAGYDHEENEITFNGQPYYIYRRN
jgi:hypothetical protein